MNKKEKWGLLMSIFGMQGATYNSLINSQVFMYLSILIAIIGISIFINTINTGGVNKK